MPKFVLSAMLSRWGTQLQTLFVAVLMSFYWLPSVVCSCYCPDPFRCKDCIGVTVRKTSQNNMCGFLQIGDPKTSQNHGFQYVQFGMIWDTPKFPLKNCMCFFPIEVLFLSLRLFLGSFLSLVEQKMGQGHQRCHCLGVIWQYLEVSQFHEVSSFQDINMYDICNVSCSACEPSEHVSIAWFPRRCLVDPLDARATC